MSTNTNTNDYHSLAEKAIKHAEKLGADQSEAYLVYGDLKSVQIERSGIRSFDDKSSSGIGIRIIKNKAIGMSSTTVLTEEGIKKTVEEAYALACAIPSDPNFVSLPSDTKEPVPIENIFDKAVKALTVEDFAQVIQETIKEAKIKEDANVEGRFTSSFGTLILLNSLGIDKTFSSTSISGYIGVKVTEGDDTGNAYYWDNQCRIKDFDYHKIAKNAAERALKMLGAKKIDTATLPVLMDPESTMDTLGGIVNGGINAFSVYNKTAYFIDKIGEEIAHKGITIIDDPFYPASPNSSGFDDEGVSAKKLTLIKKGVLETYITDSYTAPLVGLENTGHASRGSFSSRPTPSTYNLQISKGTTKSSAMLEEMKEGILLISSGLHAASPSPQISAQINQGFYVKDGEIIHPIKNAVIGTTIYDVLTKIDAISVEVESRVGLKAPWIKLADMKVSGGK